MRAFEYREPDNLEEVLALLHDHGEDAKIIAGGTALVIMLNQHLIMPSYLISLRKLSGLNSVESVDGALQLGALVTHRDMETAPVIRDQLPVLAETYKQVATLRIRNMATVGGTLAHADPSQDSPVTLMALDAGVRLTSHGGSREVPLSEFFTDYYETVLKPDELLTHVLVPLPKPHTGSIYLKFLPRTEDDYATVGVAASVEIEPSSQLCRECRIVMGGVAPTPLRVKEAEALLSGQKLVPELLHKAASVAQEHTDPISDSRGSADYKREMAGVCMRKALEQAWQRAISRDDA
jgi:carbon-monoxide dehydrogenase medium subunit